MKKTASLLLIFVLILLTFVGCGSQTASTHTQTEPQSTMSENPEASTPSDATKATANSLVVYFSLAGEQYNVGVIEEGNTAIIAKMIADETGADLFAINPVEPYPDDYDGKLDVARNEQSSNARPAFVGKVENWDSYDTIFIGYPIWWGELPNIVYTFMEQYDFTGKTVIPFCTHAGSGLSGTEKDIATVTGADMKDGLAIAGTTAQNDREAAAKQLHDWLEESDLLG